MQKDNKQMDRNSPEQIKKRNRKAVLLTIILVAFFVTFVLLMRAFFLNRGSNFGSVEGVSTSEASSLTKINFINSGSGKTSKTFGDITSPFVPNSNDKLWVSFVSGENTFIGFVGKDLKFNKVYELPSTTSLIRLFNDNSILFTDEPLKQEPALYYQAQGGEIVKFSSLDFQDTYQSIYYDPLERLIYYLGRDSSNTFFIYSINEKGIESNLFKTVELTLSSQIQYIDDKNLYLKDGDLCFSLDFATRKLNQISCENIKTSDLDFNLIVEPRIQAIQESDKAGKAILSKFDGSRTDLFELNPSQVISKASYSNNAIVFVKASLNPVGESTFVSNNVDIEVYNFDTKKVEVLTNKFPSEAVNDYINFSGNIFAVGNAHLMYFSKDGMVGQVYIGDVAPVSFASVTKYWIDIDLGGGVSNLRALRSDNLL